MPTQPRKCCGSRNQCIGLLGGVTGWSCPGCAQAGEEVKVKAATEAAREQEEIRAFMKQVLR